MPEQCQEMIVTTESPVSAVPWQPRRTESRIESGAEPRSSGSTTGMAVSEVRALFAVTAHPEIISLAGDIPYVAALPPSAIADIVKNLIAGRSAAVRESSARGDVALRERICDVMSVEGIRADPDDVVLTAGSEHSLALLARICVDPGDVVFAEAPSYVGALGAFAAGQADVVQVAMDDDGLIPDALQEAVAGVARSGRRGRLLYTVPNFHNPAGVTLAASRRARILDICRRAGLLVTEDNPYGLLGADDQLMRALRADDPDGVVYLGTFSKTFAPGMHVGWMTAPPTIMAKLILAMEPGAHSRLSPAQFAVREYLSTQPWRDHIRQLRRWYRERRDVTLDAQARLMPEGCRWTKPAGGAFTWLRLPAGVDSAAMLPRSIAAGVAYVPGTSFYIDDSGSRYARLCYSTMDRHQLREGIRRLAAVIEQEAAAHERLGTDPRQQGGGSAAR